MQHTTAAAFLATLWLLIGAAGPLMAETRIWEPVEIAFEAEGSYDNPYTQVELWVRLRGPGFDKRIPGFWDGGGTWKVRVLATTPGDWSWRSAANVDDPGLAGHSGGFTAVAWSEREKRANPNRRGMIRPTPNGHALQYSDGTPFFMLADTAYPLLTGRILYQNKPAPDEVEPHDRMSFEELVAYRKGQGYNAFAVIASFPNWRPDDHPDSWTLGDGTVMRDAGSWSSHDRAKDMDYPGGVSPFELGGVEGMPPEGANYDRINPAYWRRADRKMQHLWEQGMVVFLEGVRRDHRDSWKRWFDFHPSFARYTRYLVARYGVYNVIFSPVHADYVPEESYKGDIREAIGYWHGRDGAPPFGNLVTVLAENSYAWFGDPQWMTAHNVGNTPRNNDKAEQLADLYKLGKPAFNSEPYYPGLQTSWGRPDRGAGPNPEPNTPLSRYFVRTQAYYSILNGGLAGHVYGTAGWSMTWAGEAESETTRHYWKTLRYESGADMQKVKRFILSLGDRYADLAPARSELAPHINKGGHPQLSDLIAERAALMITPDRALAVAYFQPGARSARIGGLTPDHAYRAEWIRAADAERISQTTIATDSEGHWRFSRFPDDDEVADEDWLLKLTSAGAD